MPEREAEFEAQFAQLVKDVEEGRKAAIEEPSARARMLAAKWREQPPPSAPWRGEAPSLCDDTTKPKKGSATGRVWPRNLTIAVIIGALTVGIVEMMRHNGSHGAPTASAANGTPSVTRSASGSASAVSQIPVSRLFPRTVQGAGGTVYTLVT